MGGGCLISRFASGTTIFYAFSNINPTAHCCTIYEYIFSDMFLCGGWLSRHYSSETATSLEYSKK